MTLCSFLFQAFITTMTMTTGFDSLDAVSPINRMTVLPMRQLAPGLSRLGCVGSEFTGTSITSESGSRLALLTARTCNCQVTWDLLQTSRCGSRALGTHGGNTFMNVRPRFWSCNLPYQPSHLSFQLSLQPCKDLGQGEEVA